VGGLAIGLWAVPYYFATDWHSVYRSWANQAASRFTLSEPERLLAHMAGYPFEVLACMLPWSILLLAYLFPGFWRKLAGALPHVQFLLTALAVSFLPLWICQGARNRYFMPLYPCAALLVGLAIERCWQLDARGVWESSWRRFSLGLIVAMPGVAAAVLGASLIPRLAETPVAQPLPFALLYAVGAALLAGALWRAWHWAPRLGWDSALWRQRAGTLSIAAFLGLTSSGVRINSELRTSEDLAASVARLKEQLPGDIQMVSFGRAHHRFVWHYGRFIQQLPWPDDPQSLSPDVGYFCFEGHQSASRELPFAWEQVAEISCERNHMANPYDKMIVGRRLPDAPSAAQAPPHPRR
jgi:hypothetical protein